MRVGRPSHRNRPDVFKRRLSGPGCLPMGPCLPLANHRIPGSSLVLESSQLFNAGSLPAIRCLRACLISSLATTLTYRTASAVKSCPRLCARAVLSAASLLLARVCVLMGVGCCRSFALPCFSYAPPIQIMLRLRLVDVLALARELMPDAACSRVEAYSCATPWRCSPWIVSSALVGSLVQFAFLPTGRRLGVGPCYIALRAES